MAVSQEHIESRKKFRDGWHESILGRIVDADEAVFLVLWICLGLFVSSLSIASRGTYSMFVIGGGVWVYGLRVLKTGEYRSFFMKALQVRYRTLMVGFLREDC